MTKASCYSICYNMIKETKVRRIGNSLGVVLPKEVLHDLKVEEGATLYITGDAEGSLRLTAENPEFKEMMAIAKRGLNRSRNALRELAK